MTPFTQVQKGVAAYLDNEVMPFIDDNTWKKVAAGAAISIAINRSSNFIPLFQENKFVKAMGLMDDKGAIDIDALVPAIKANVPKDGMTIDIPMLGTLRLKADDVDKIHRYIKQASQS